MNRIHSKQRPASQHSRWSRPARVVVSLFLILHVTAVFLPPFTFMTSPVRGMGSPLAEVMMRSMSWYIDSAYLNHGYAFFAPDPGPSHLLRAKLEFSDGRPSETVTLPDLQRHWPRLLYHRHFMLSEHLHSAFVPPDPPPEIIDIPMELDRWRQARQMYEARRAAVERHLLRQFGADSIELTRIEHRLLDPYEFAVQKKRITDLDTYVELSDDTPLEEQR